MWECERLRELSINKMSTFDVEAGEKLCLAMKYKIERWCEPAIEQLIRRKEPMGIEDMKKIGIDYALKVASIRECTWEITSYGSGWKMEERGELNGKFGAEMSRKINGVFGSFFVPKIFACRSK